MPKMIKIGEIRVLNYFDLPWNEPRIKRKKREKYENGGKKIELF